MATYTDNYNLIKPTYAETADIVPLNNNFEKIDEVMHASQTSLAPAYDQEASYQPGDVVMYELNMYKCTGATSGTWDPSKWTRTTAAETGGGGSADFDIFGEGSGSVVTITDGAEAGLAECIAEIEASQDLHGYSKPWAGGAGKNKLEVAAQSTTDNGITYTVNEDGTITATGTANANSTLIVTNDANVGPGSYIVNGCPQGGSTSTYRLYFEWNDAGGLHGGLDIGTEQTINNVTSIGRFIIQIYPAAGNVNLTFKPMIRLATVQDDSYEPYSNICPINGYTDVNITVSDGETDNVTTIPLDRTVYVGTLDVTRGILTVTSKGVDLGTLTWTAQGTSDASKYRMRGLITPDIAKAVPNNQAFNAICSIYEAISANNTYSCNLGISGDNTGNYIFVYDDNYNQSTDAPNFASFVNGQYLVYELATPQTYTLTPEEVSTILGYNNISADSGEVSVVYVKQTAPIKPNPTGADIPLTGLEISGKDFVITDARIPAPPTTSGAYVLTVTVSGGTPIYSWENAQEE